MRKKRGVRRQESGDRSQKTGEENPTMGRPPAQSFRDLVVWRKAHEFVLGTYRFTSTFPKHETYGLASQMRPAGVSVPANTIDAIHQELNLSRVHFLKMNIEGSERLAIRGMAATLKETEILCVSCHDFLAHSVGDDGLRTKELVRDFLRHNGLEVVERSEPGLAPHLRDQLWAYNRQLIKRPAA